MENTLYSFRRCPYAMRARWALMITGQVVVLREVILRNKPQELFNISPKGTVPVLHTSEGEILDESLEIMLWTLRINDKFNILCKNDTNANRQIKQIIEKNDGPFKYHLDRYKYAKRFDNSQREYHRDCAKKILLDWNSRLDSENSKAARWLVNSKETLADWAVWPFVRQYRNVDPEFFDQDNNIGHIREWLKSYSHNPKFELLMVKSKPWSPLDKAIFFPSNYSFN